MASRFEKLSVEEENDLVRRCQAGDRRAGDRLLEVHERILRQFAYRARRRGVENDDLYQEARAGFLDGVGRFDPSRGVRLLTLAQHWIRSAITKAVRRQGSLVRVPRVDDEGAREGTVLAAKAALQRTVSLDAPDPRHLNPDHDDEPLVSKMISSEADPEERYVEREREAYARFTLARLLEILTPRERFIIEARLCADEPTTLEDLGARYGVSRERARQIEGEAITKLQRAAYARGLVRKSAA